MLFSESTRHKNQTIHKEICNQTSKMKLAGPVDRSSHKIPFSQADWCTSRFQDKQGYTLCLAALYLDSQSFLGIFFLSNKDQTWSWEVQLVKSFFFGLCQRLPTLIFNWENEWWSLLTMPQDSASNNIASSTRAMREGNGPLTTFARHK